MLLLICICCLFALVKYPESGCWRCWRCLKPGHADYLFGIFLLSLNWIHFCSLHIWSSLDWYLRWAGIVWSMDFFYYCASLLYNNKCETNASENMLQYAAFTCIQHVLNRSYNTAEVIEVKSCVTGEKPPHRHTVMLWACTLPLTSSPTDITKLATTRLHSQAPMFPRSESHKQRATPLCPRCVSAVWLQPWRISSASDFWCLTGTCLLPERRPAVRLSWEISNRMGLITSDHPPQSPITSCFFNFPYLLRPQSRAFDSDTMHHHSQVDKVRTHTHVYRTNSKHVCSCSEPRARLLWASPGNDLYANT